MVLSRYLQFYKAPRVFRITNKEGFPEFVEFSIGSEIDENGDESNVANVRRVANAGGQFSIGPVQKMPIKGVPDVTVTSGSSLPFARAQKTATALDLHGRGAITLESMLKAIQWPDPEEETKKVKEEQAILAQQQGVQGG